MSVWSFLIAAIFILFMTTAQPAYAGADSAAVDGPGVVVHWFVEAPQSASPIGGNHYKPPQPIQGLWQSPDQRELRLIYLDRLRDRRSDQAVPLLVVEW